MFHAPLVQEVELLLRSAAAGHGGALLLCGTPGSGRTTLLNAAVPPGWTILTAPGHAAERSLPFAALHRLLPLPPTTSYRPGPTSAHDAPRHRSDATAGDTALAAVARRGELLLSHLRALAADRPVLCLLDDAHLLDIPSAQAISYTARRVTADRIAFLATGPPGVTLFPARHLRPLSVEESRALLLTRAPDLTADVAITLTELAGGNLAALIDLATSLSPAQRRGYASLPDTLPPESPLRQRLRAELAALPSATRDLLLLAAADPPSPLPDLLATHATHPVSTGADPTPSSVPTPSSPNAAGLRGDSFASPRSVGSGDLSTPLGTAGPGSGLIDLLPAEQAGLVTVEGTHVRFGSPVARVMTYREMPLIVRRNAHLALAETASAHGRRLDALLHRAAAGITADPALAAELIEAASRATPSSAAEALRHAAELSPDPVERDNALLSAARAAWLAGRPHEATRLIRDAQQDPTHPEGEVPRSILAGSRLGPLVACGRSGNVDNPRTAAGPAGTRLRARGIAAEMRPDEPASREILMDVAAEIGEADPVAALHALSLAGEAVCLAGEKGRYLALARRITAGQRGDETPGVAMAYHHVAGLAELAAGREDAAFGRFRRELALAGDVAEPVPLMRAATAGILVGDARGATSAAGRAAVLAGAGGAHSLVPRALELAALAGMASGDYDAATTASLDGVALARGTGQSALAGTHLGMLAVLAALVGDRASGQARIRAATGTDQARPLCEWALALLDLVDGRPRAAAERLRMVVAGPPGRGSVLLRVAVVPHLLEAAGPEPALNPVARAFDDWAGRTGQAGWLALRDRCRALRTRDGEAAEAHFHAALRRVGDGGFPRAHTELLYGRLLRRRRRHVAAREHLRRAAETFRLLGAEPWAAQSVRELRAAGERPELITVTPAPRDGDAVLTAQQERIATLVAEGATNREVAQELHLSTRTVDHHLRNVFARLGVRSRTEMAHLLAAR